MCHKNIQGSLHLTNLRDGLRLTDAKLGPPTQSIGYHAKTNMPYKVEPKNVGLRAAER